MEDTPELKIESTPESLAKATILSTLIANQGKEYALTKDSIDVVFPIDLEEFIEKEEEWFLDQMEKVGVEDIPEDDLKAVYKDCMKTYTFEALRKIFPKGFERKLTQEEIDEIINKCNEFNWEELNDNDSEED